MLILLYYLTYFSLLPKYNFNKNFLPIHLIEIIKSAVFNPGDIANERTTHLRDQGRNRVHIKTKIEGSNMEIYNGRGRA